MGGAIAVFQLTKTNKKSQNLTLKKKGRKKKNAGIKKMKENKLFMVN